MNVVVLRILLQSGFHLWVSAVLGHGACSGEGLTAESESTPPDPTHASHTRTTDLEGNAFDSLSWP